MPIDILTARHWNTPLSPPVDTHPLAAFFAVAALNAAVSIGQPPIVHGQDISTGNTGRAGAAAAGVANYSASLVTVNGDQVISGSQTIRNTRYTGKVTITGGTPTFEFCSFEYQPAAAAAAVYQYDGGADAGIVTLNWCDIDSGLRGAQGLFETCGFQAGERGNNPATTGSRFALYRCRVAGYGNALGLHQWRSAASSSVLECYLGPVTHGGGNHPDGIECYSSGNILIDRTRIDLSDFDQSCVNITTDFGNLPSGDPVTVRDSYMSYGIAPVLCRWFNQGGGTYIKNVSFMGNRFGDQGHYGRVADFNSMNVTYNQAYAQANPTVIYWAPDNVWAPNGEGVTGGVAFSGDTKGALPHVPGASILAGNPPDANFFGGEVWVWSGSVVGPSPGVAFPGAASLGITARDATAKTNKVQVAPTVASAAIVAQNAGVSLGSFLPFYLDPTNGPRRVAGDLLYVDSAGVPRSKALSVPPASGVGWSRQGQWNIPTITGNGCVFDGYDLDDTQVVIAAGVSNWTISRCHGHNLFGPDTASIRPSGGGASFGPGTISDCLFEGAGLTVPDCLGYMLWAIESCGPISIYRTIARRCVQHIGFNGGGVGGLVQDCYLDFAIDPSGVGTWHIESINVTGKVGTQILHDRIIGVTGQTCTIMICHDHGDVGWVTIDACELLGFPQNTIYAGDTGESRFGDVLLPNPGNIRITNNKVAKANGQNPGSFIGWPWPPDPRVYVAGNTVLETGVAIP